MERHGPAQQAGLEVGDELLAIDGQRLSSVEGLTAHIRLGTPEPPLLQLLIARRQRVETLSLRLAPPRTKRWVLQIDPEAAADCAFSVSAACSPAS